MKAIATELRGKAISSTVYPLSFVEFLKFKDFSQSHTCLEMDAKSRLIRILSASQNHVSQFAGPEMYGT